MLNSCLKFPFILTAPPTPPTPPELSTDLTDRSRVVEDGWIRILLEIGSTEFRQDMTSTVGWVTKEVINSTAIGLWSGTAWFECKEGKVQGKVNDDA